ncbi:arylesterase [Agriterribacter sp.]|uniref:arylesterase n=1 Tax=Agriterribacter sp. TaxID=2821509 RepID=UPI002B92F950|nr:arylesterase [Agriterribacter sp.]HRN56465.1 arylesterase [Agriterribacter sp.]HRP58193.1 arylesterase [Agriterribacter sp.]HRQ48907.1 arylesterase [Agriterribacter sp.]
MLKIKIYGILLLMLHVACNDPDSTPATTAKDSAGTETPPPSSSIKNIVFFGNSLTAGYGLDLSEAYPALIQAKIDSLKLPYKVINAGLSGETTAGGNSRINWILKQPVHVFVLELGGNDGLRGIPLEETKKNLQEIINKVKEKFPDAKLMLTGMRVPPNMGRTYSENFHKIFTDLANNNKIALLPFLLEGVGGEPELNQADGIHPTAEGQKIVAENVWAVLKGLLQAE